MSGPLVRSGLCRALQDGPKEAVRVDWSKLPSNALVLGVGGEPAAGKTRLMRALMARLGVDASRVARLAAPGAQPVKGHHGVERRVYVLGDYSPSAGGFGGTDKLSMSVQPHALALVRHYAEDGREQAGATPLVFLFEGDRLFNGSFIGSVRELPAVDSAFVVLTASAEAKHARHRARGDGQSGAFVRGRATKYANLLSFVGGLEAWPHETEADTGVLVDRLCRRVVEYVASKNRLTGP